MNTRPSQTGFTIIELMIGITVLAVLLSLAVPNMRDFILRNRLTTQTNDMVGALQFARSESIKRGVPVGIIRTGAGDWSGGWQIWVDTDVDNTIDAPGEVVLRTQTALTGLAALAVTNNGGVAQTTLRYLPNGAVNAAFTARICTTNLTTDNERQLAVTASGAAQLTKGSNPPCT